MKLYPLYITIKDSKNKTIKTIKKASGNKVYSLTKLKTNAKYTIIVKATTKDATYVVCSKSFKTLPIVSKNFLNQVHNYKLYLFHLLTMLLQ